MRNRIYIMICMIALLTVCTVFAQETGFIPYKLNKKWVVIDTSCQIISKEKYDTICLMVRGFACVKKHNKWGYINKNGETVIPIIYNRIGNFNSDFMAKVQKNSKWGYLNKKGEVTIPLIYDELNDFNEYYDVTLVRIKDSSYYIDKKGRKAAPPNSYVIDGNSGCNNIDFMAFEIKGKNGFGLQEMTERLQPADTLVPCIYKKISYAMESRFAILINEKYSLYNTVEKKMLIENCDSIYFYLQSTCNYWVFYKKGKTNGFIAPYSSTLVETNYTSLKIINTNFIYITDDKKLSYYMNSKGKKYIPKIN